MGGLTTPAIAKTARNSFDSANTPSVICLPSFPCLNLLRLIRPREACGHDELTGVAQLLRELLYERDVRFENFLRHFMYWS